MLRSPALRDLSSEHHVALRLARMCERAASSADRAEIQRAHAEVLRSYENELSAHFRLEEETLLPLLFGTPSQTLAERTLAEHRLLRDQLNRLRDDDGPALQRFGELLKAHVRFEERELFPALEGKFAHQD